MNRCLPLLCATLCLLPLACAAPRHECSAPTIRHYHHACITAVFRDASIRDVMGTIAREAHRTIRVVAGIEERVSVDFRGCPWRLAAEIAAMSAGCTVREDDAGLVVRRAGPVTIEFDHADLAQAIRTLAAYGDCDVTFVPEVKGEVSTGFLNWEWRSALDSLATRAGGRAFSEGFGHVVVAPDAQVMQKRMAPKVFSLGSTRPSHAGMAGSSLPDPAKGIGLVEGLCYMLTRADASSTPAQTLGQLEYNGEANSVLVVDTPAVQDRIGHLLAELGCEVK